MKFRYTISCADISSVVLGKKKLRTKQELDLFFAHLECCNNNNISGSGRCCKQCQQRLPELKKQLYEWWEKYGQFLPPTLDLEEMSDIYRFGRVTSE